MPSRLSFVVPVYQPDLNILAKCVKSLCEQSLREWDAVFVIDGDSPGAKEVIRAGMKKKANHYKVIEQEHGGAQKARNSGAQHATGEFVCFFDSDCLIEPESAQLWLKAFDKEPDVAFVYGSYKFLGEKGAIESQPFDPWLLKVRNYISTCFPVRREFVVKWDESLKSLQDWSFWLSVVEKGGKGKYIPGFHFSTVYPEAKSISGQGCTDEVWLERIDAVKKLHSLPERDVCVSSLQHKHEGVWLAKLIDADYQDYPNWKPHRYKTIIQIGFSLLPNAVEAHTSIFNERHVKKVLFWTCSDITDIYSRLNLNAIQKYSILLNSMENLKQYVEDKTAYDMMRRAGFHVEIRPLPMETREEVPPLPEKPRFAVDFNSNYSPILTVLQMSLPDVELVPLDGAAKLTEFTGLVHLHPDRTVSPGMKRAHLAGRHVVSNVQAPFAGYIDDTKDLAVFIPETVEAIRAAVAAPAPVEAKQYYSKLVNAKEFAHAL